MNRTQHGLRPMKRRPGNGGRYLWPLGLLLLATACVESMEPEGLPVDPVPLAAPAEGCASGRWRGVMELPGTEMAFVVDFAQGDGPGTTIDIPAQGVAGLALADVSCAGGKLIFTIAEAKPDGAVFAATIGEDGKRAVGTFTQAGQTFPIRMELLAEGADVGPLRPQLPVGPFLYMEREVAYTNGTDGTTLAGTLTIPAGPGPHPAAIMITGSGAQDRDQSIMGHKPFLVIADHLTRNGIAVLRVDDRGVGGSSGTTHTSTSAEFAGDVLAGLSFLAGQPEIDAGRIGLIGHSEGGMVAVMVAARSPDPAFVVMLAGPGLPGREILSLQLGLIQRAGGREEENVVAQLAAQATLLDLLAAGAEEESVRAALAALAELQIGELPPEQALSEEGLQAVLDAEYAKVDNAWFRFFVSYDPTYDLKGVVVPLLALNGSLDLQVPAPQNLAAIERIVGMGNEDVTVMELAGLNHLFQTAATGHPAEYAAIEETFSPTALEIMAGWILERFANPSP